MEYNSPLRIVERRIFEVREAIFKACDGNESKWSGTHTRVFGAERSQSESAMGCSPYLQQTGTHLFSPIDILEANYFAAILQIHTDYQRLIARRACYVTEKTRPLAKLQDKAIMLGVQAAIRFEKEHARTIRLDFKLGDLVLVRNTAIEKALNRKIARTILGPLIVLSRNKGGAYVRCELDGSVFDRPVAAFRGHFPILRGASRSTTP